MYKIKRMGRLPPYKDPRVYSPGYALDLVVNEKKGKLVTKERTSSNLIDTLKRLGNTEIELPKEYYNTDYLPPVRDQGDLGTCVSFSCIAMIEYLGRLLHKTARNFSQLYNYKMGRDYAFGTAGEEGHGDTGLWLKDGIASLVKHGAVGAERYPYDIELYDEYPPAHIHTYADDYQSVKYFRLDYPNVSIEKRKERINTYLSNKWPVIAGFYVFESADMENMGTGEFAYPSENEQMLGGHAVMLYGYDDNKVINNPITGDTTTGAWKLRNSWGDLWGINGDGWLPYDYLTKPTAEMTLADEFYTVTRMEWLDLWDFEE